MAIFFSLSDDKLTKGGEGRDASGLFQNKSTKWNDIAFLRSTSNSQPWLTVVTDRYKLIYSSLGKPWLYDLKNDPGETNNLIDNVNFNSEIQKLQNKMLSWYQETCDVVPLKIDNRNF